ncbi:hypothetical protein HUW62_46165 [Myxococcus sp. AM011]|nr:hypothetical protein [Myxococcus sp. AM011]
MVPFGHVLACEAHAALREAVFLGNKLLSERDEEARILQQPKLLLGAGA